VAARECNRRNQDSHINMDSAKLLIRGVAPSAEMWRTESELLQINRHAGAMQSRSRNICGWTSRTPTSSIKSSLTATRRSVPPITTNTAFSEWGNILYNTTIATAVADRLVENSGVFLLGGDSFRKAGKNPQPPAE
jgi:hypothetical protein